ncbi:MAG TPA: tetratricopeptide repeat protein, partial [Gemmataceae bacterium]|nr:tetratricopeptide repeat protein [Gemmataceae bacterium]
RLYFRNWQANALVAMANLDAIAEPPPESSGTRLREALKIFRGLEPKVRKDNPEIRFERAATHMSYADYLRAARKPAEAVAAYQDVVSLLSDDEWYPNPRPHHHYHKAIALRRWGGVLFELGEPERAVEQLTQAADILRSLAASGQPGDYAAFRLDALAERALARWAAGKHDDARADAEEVVRKFPTKGRRVWRAKGLWVLGESARLKKDFARAREQLNEVLAADDNKADRTEIREWLHVRALAQLSLGEAESDRSAASRHYKSAQELLTKLTESHPELPRYGRVREVVDKLVRDPAE